MQVVRAAATDVPQTTEDDRQISFRPEAVATLEITLRAILFNVCAQKRVSMRSGLKKASACVPQLLEAWEAHAPVGTSGRQRSG
jgi:hypothetical protein